MEAKYNKNHPCFYKPAPEVEWSYRLQGLDGELLLDLSYWENGSSKVSVTVLGGGLFRSLTAWETALWTVPVTLANWHSPDIVSAWWEDSTIESSW